MKLNRLAALALCIAPACVSSPLEPGDGAPADAGVGGERSPSVRTLHSMARVLAAQGRDAQCQLVLEKLIREYPDFMPAYVELAELLMRQGQSYDASQVLAVAVGHNPSDPVVQNDLGMALLLADDPAAALEHFEAAIAFAPEDARGKANRAAALGLLGRYEEALEAYLEIVPPEDAHFNLGVLAEASGDSVRAQREFAIADAFERGGRGEPPAPAAPAPPG
jgi:tetratricopeptide (TPR) repeat protein